MNITTIITEAIESRFTGDFKQDLYIRILDLSEETTFESTEDLGKWLSKLAINQYGNDRWKESNRTRLMEENDTEIRNLYGYNDTVDDPLDIILANEFEDKVLKSLSSLEKDIYGLYQQGESYLMISEALKMSQVAIRKHVSRIKRKFHA